MTQNLSLFKPMFRYFLRDQTFRFAILHTMMLTLPNRTLPHLFVVPNKSTKNWDIDNANRPFESANHIQNDPWCMLSIAFRYDARRGSKYQKASILQIADVYRLLNCYVLWKKLFLIGKSTHLNHLWNIEKTCILS